MKSRDTSQYALTKVALLPKSCPNTIKRHRIELGNPTLLAQEIAMNVWEAPKSKSTNIGTVLTMNGFKPPKEPPQPQYVVMPWIDLSFGIPLVGADVAGLDKSVWVPLISCPLPQNIDERP